METAVLAVSAYLLGTFLLSALIVRFAPQAHSARQVRKHLVLFTVLPLMLVVDILSTIDACLKLSNRALCKTFELISGRRLLSGDEHAYAYFGYSRRRQNRRKGDRRARSMGKRKVAVAK